jgi:type III secretion protein U
MAESSGDKTEKPTPKRLLDARKKGDIPKSRDLGTTVTLLVWLGLFAAIARPAAQRLQALSEQLFVALAQGWDAGGFILVARSMGGAALECLLWISLVLLVPVAAAGLLTDFLQVGAVWALEKITPKMEHLNPAAGIKRMFSMDSLVELVKNILKSALLLALAWLLVRNSLPQWLGLARQSSEDARPVAAMLWDASWRLAAWSIAAFVVVALLDALWQRHSFTKKLRMSLRDIKQEYKDNEGDPIIKQQRRQAHAEWAQQNSSQAARTANALVVNPTHVAIAIDYDRERCPVPLIAAKGEGDVAAPMRAAAEESGVPIVRNVPLARDLLARAEVGEAIPPDLFDIIAEVILWAAEAREAMKHEADAAPGAAARSASAQPPGEDLTRYAGDRAAMENAP